MSDSESEDRQPEGEAPDGIMAAIQQMESAFNSSLRQVTSRIDQLTELVLSKPSGAETPKGRTAKVAESPKGKSPLHGGPWRRKSASSSAESRAEDEQVAETTHWADRTGNLADGPILEFPDDDDEQDPACEVQVSEHTQKLLTSVFTHTVTNTERRKVRQEFLVPNVDNTRCPKLDSIFKAPGSAFKGEAKSAESDLSRIQAYVLDPVGPLVQLLEGTREGTLTKEAAESAITAAITFVGNASSHISKLRRKKVLKELNPDLQDLAGDDTLFKVAAPKLFGTGFEKTLKERAEAMKLLKGARPPQKGAQKQFFRGTHPSGPRRGGGYNTNRGGRGRLQPYQYARGKDSYNNRFPPKR